MKDTPAEKCAAIIAHYGIENQLDQLQEECGELIAAVNHSRRQGRLSDEFWEEIADVRIMLKQFETLIDQKDRTWFDDKINFKLDRQLKRIKEERTE